MTIKWLSSLNGKPLEWILKSDPFIKYSTLTHLLDQLYSSNDVIISKKEMYDHPLVRKLINDTFEWFLVLTKRHDDSNMSLLS